MGEKKWKKTLLIDTDDAARGADGKKGNPSSPRLQQASVLEKDQQATGIENKKPKQIDKLDASMAN